MKHTQIIGMAKDNHLVTCKLYLHSIHIQDSMLWTDLTEMLLHVFHSYLLLHASSFPFRPVLTMPTPLPLSLHLPLPIPPPIPIPSPLFPYRPILLPLPSPSFPHSPSFNAIFFLPYLSHPFPYILTLFFLTFLLSFPSLPVFRLYQSHLQAGQS